MTIAINQKPVFTKNGVFKTGATISAANTAKDGTGTVVTVFDAQQTLTALTSTGTTATATTTTPHGYLNGEEILITGAAEAGYNGIKTITVTGAKTFTYTVTAGLATPATGTIVSIPSTVPESPNSSSSRLVRTWPPPRAFLNNGQTAATAANNTYLDDVTLAASTLSEVASMAGTDMALEIVVPPFHKINVVLGTAVAAGYAVYAVVGVTNACRIWFPKSCTIRVCSRYAKYV